MTIQLQFVTYAVALVLGKETCMMPFSHHYHSQLWWLLRWWIEARQRFSNSLRVVVADLFLIYLQYKQDEGFKETIK